MKLLIRCRGRRISTLQLVDPASLFFIAHGSFFAQLEMAAFTAYSSGRALFTAKWKNRDEANDLWILGQVGVPAGLAFVICPWVKGQGYKTA